MKVILFDLGNTLEHNGSLIDGALEILEKIKNMKDENGQSPILALASDFKPAFSNEEIEQKKSEYYTILENFHIKSFFEPVETNVILSTEVGHTKTENPQRFFQTVIDKIGDTSFPEIIFMTENELHIKSANSLKMKTIQLKLDNNNSTKSNQYIITNLLDSINIIRDFINCNA